LLNDYYVVVAGLNAMMEPFSDRLRIVDESVDDAADLEDHRVDVTLYDTFASSQVDRSGIEDVVSDPNSGAVVIYSWNTQPDLVETALAKGCRGYLAKTLPAGELVEALERVAAGERVVRESGTGPGGGAREPETAWPGKAHGLTSREAEVIALVTQGMSNAEIAVRSYITINSLKSYIRSAYRKMGVERRAQAVRWGMEHGMLPPGDEAETVS